MLVTHCVSFFSVAVVNYHDQKLLKEESLFWLIIPERGSIMAGAWQQEQQAVAAGVQGRLLTYEGIWEQRADRRQGCAIDLN